MLVSASSFSSAPLVFCVQRVSRPNCNEEPPVSLKRLRKLPLPIPGAIRMTIKVDGRCHCGAIAYQAEVEPGAMAICHCEDCQILTGTAFRANIPATAASF